MSRAEANIKSIHHEVNELTICRQNLRNQPANFSLEGSGRLIIEDKIKFYGMRCVECRDLWKQTAQERGNDIFPMIEQDGDSQLKRGGKRFESDRFMNWRLWMGDCRLQFYRGGRRALERERRGIQPGITVALIGLEMTSFRPFIPRIDED